MTFTHCTLRSLSGRVLQRYELSNRCLGGGIGTAVQLAIYFLDGRGFAAQTESCTTEDSCRARDIDLTGHLCALMALVQVHKQDLVVRPAMIGIMISLMILLSSKQKLVRIMVEFIAVLKDMHDLGAGTGHVQCMEPVMSVITAVNVDKKYIDLRGFSYASY